jgi:hypothetical protein
MADIQKSKRLRQLAGILVARCQEAGVTLFADQAAEILAKRVRMTALGMRLTERYTLDRYFDEESVTTLAAVMIRQVEENRRLADEAPPLTVAVEDAAHVIAGFGVTVTIAARHLDDPDALGLIDKAGDAVVLFGLAITDSSCGGITLVGQDVVYPRTVLTHVLEKLRDGQWTCVCGADHDDANPCGVQQRLLEDLVRLGSWLSADAPPADSESPERMLRVAQEQFFESLGFDLDRLADHPDDQQPGL